MPLTPWTQPVAAVVNILKGFLLKNLQTRQPSESDITIPIPMWDFAHLAWDWVKPDVKGINLMKKCSPNKFSPKKIFTQKFFRTNKFFTESVRLSFVDLRWAQLYVSLVVVVFVFVLTSLLKLFCLWNRSNFLDVSQCVWQKSMTGRERWSLTAFSCCRRRCPTMPSVKYALLCHHWGT